MLTGDCEVEIQTNQQGVITAQNDGPRKKIIHIFFNVPEFKVTFYLRMKTDIYTM